MAHRNRKKKYPYKPVRPKNHNFKKDIEQQKETEIKREKKYQAKPSVGKSSQSVTKISTPKKTLSSWD